jgi:hypothetical protein
MKETITMPLDRYNELIEKEKMLSNKATYIKGFFSSFTYSGIEAVFTDDEVVIQLTKELIQTKERNITLKSEISDLKHETILQFLKRKLKTK